MKKFSRSEITFLASASLVFAFLISVARVQFAWIDDSKVFPVGLPIWMPHTILWIGVAGAVGVIFLAVHRLFERTARV